MHRSGRNGRSWTLDHCYSNSYTDQTGAEYCPCLSAHYSGLSGGHGEGVNSTGVTSIAYPGASAPEPSFYTPSYQGIYEEGSSFQFHQQGSAYYAIPPGPQALSCDHISQAPATVSDKVLCDSGGNQDMGATPASSEYSPCLSAHYSGLSGDHGEGVNSTGVTPIAYPSAPEPSFHTPSYPGIYEEGSSFQFHQQGSAYAIPPGPQVLSCDYISQAPATVSDKAPCDSGGNQDTDAYYPASAPAEQWDVQAVLRSMSCPADYIQPPFVAHSPPKNKVAVTSASPESSADRGNVISDIEWNQDMGTYSAHSAQWDAQPALGPILSNTGDKQPTSVAPPLFEDEAASISFTVSSPKGPTHNTYRHCPICPASFRRLQDRKRHISSHLPHWLQCQVPACPWRGDRWEHLRKHRLNVHPSISQESDTPESVIYDPWPLVEGITDNTTFEIAKTIAISLVEEKAKELKKLELWGDLCGRRRRRSRKVYSQYPR